MPASAMSNVVKERVSRAAQQLGAANPVEYVGPLIDRSFPLPMGSPAYGDNRLTPGATPFEPSYSESEPNSLRFTMSPLEPGAPAFARRNEATRCMRGLVGPVFGSDALRWFDQRSEEWRGMGGTSRLQFGAWFGSACDSNGLSAAKVYYEMQPQQVDSMPLSLKALVRVAAETLPDLKPIFTSIKCGRDEGRQRVTFQHRGPLAVSALGPLLNRLGMAHQIGSLMQIVGLCLGGRFDLPANSVLLALSNTSTGPEFKLEVLLGMIPDLPSGFLELLRLAMSERPRESVGLDRWLRAFTPEEYGGPGQFSVLSIRVTPQARARVSLYLRPVEFEIQQQMNDAMARTA